MPKKPRVSHKRPLHQTISESILERFFRRFTRLRLGPLQNRRTSRRSTSSFFLPRPFGLLPANGAYPTGVVPPTIFG
jgi:hypothetical protein